jgi:hypothetical protein
VRLALEPVNEPAERRFLCQTCHSFVPTDAPRLS